MNVLRLLANCLVPLVLVVYTHAETADSKSKAIYFPVTKLRMKLPPGWSATRKEGKNVGEYLINTDVRTSETKPPLAFLVYHNIGPTVMNRPNTTIQEFMDRIYAPRQTATPPHHTETLGSMEYEIYEGSEVREVLANTSTGLLWLQIPRSLRTRVVTDLLRNITIEEIAPPGTVEAEKIDDHSAELRRKSMDWSGSNLRWLYLLDLEIRLPALKEWSATALPTADGVEVRVGRAVSRQHSEVTEGVIIEKLEIEGDSSRTFRDVTDAKMRAWWNQDPPAARVLQFNNSRVHIYERSCAAFYAFMQNKRGILAIRGIGIPSELLQFILRGFTFSDSAKTGDAVITSKIAKKPMYDPLAAREMPNCFSGLAAVIRDSGNVELTKFKPLPTHEENRTAIEQVFIVVQGTRRNALSAFKTASDYQCKNNLQNVTDQTSFKPHDGTSNQFEFVASIQRALDPEDGYQLPAPAATSARRVRGRLP